MPSCPEVHTKHLRNYDLHSLAMDLALVDNRAVAVVRPQIDIRRFVVGRDLLREI